MTISNAFLDTCYDALVYKNEYKYRGYTLKWIKQQQELRLMKKSRKLASWFVEYDKLLTYENEKNPAENRMVKQFLLVPQSAESMFQLQRKQRAEQQKKKEQKKQALQERFMSDVNQYCSQLKDDEITEEYINQMVRHLATKYIDEWYVVGIHPDRYDDNFPMYFDVSCSRVRSALCDVEDERIRSFISSNYKKKPEEIIAELIDDEIIAKTHIIPIRAQREGNLVTITALEDKRFENFTEGSIQFAEDLVKKNILDYVPNILVEIYWWEKEAQYFIPQTKEDQEAKEPSSFREMILSPNKNCKKIKPKSKARPSRIQLEVRFNQEDNEVKIRKFKPQLGIIEWSINEGK